MMPKDENISECYSKILDLAECICGNNSTNISNWISQEQSLLYYDNKNYKKSIECSMKLIIYHKNRILDVSAWQNKVGIWDDSLDYLIETYRHLVKAYGASKNYEMIREILNVIEFQCSNTKDKFLLYAAIGEIYYFLNDFDKAYKTIWKCIKISKQEIFIKSYDLSNLWIYLADIRTWEGNLEKAHQYLYNAKSLLSILPKADSNEQEIYKALGVFYLNSQRYKEAREYFKLIRNKWSEHELLFAKLSMGIAYFWTLNFEKACKFLSEAKKIMYKFTESYKILILIK